MSNEGTTITIGQGSVRPMGEDTSIPSALLEESGAADPFTVFFEPTLSHHDWRESGAEWLSNSTQLVYEIRTAARRFRAHQGQPTSADAAVDALSADRLALLARKYAASTEASEENTARLLIVTERLRKLFPAVTEQDMTSLEQLMLEMSDVAATDKEIRAELPPAD